MLDAIVKTKPSLDISTDACKYRVSSYIAKPPKPPSSSAWYAKRSQGYLEDLHRSFDIAAHLHSSICQGTRDLSRMTNLEKEQWGKRWKDTVDEIVDTSIRVLAEEEHVNICKPLAETEFTGARNINWSKAMYKELKFCSKDEPRYHDINLENYSKCKLDGEKSELNLSIEFLQDLFREIVPHLSKITVPSHTMAISYPDCEGEYIQDISKLVISFDPTRGMYGLERSSKNALKEDDPLTLSCALKGAVQTAALIDRVHCAQKGISRPNHYKKEHLENIASRLASLDGETSLLGKRVWCSVKALSPAEMANAPAEDHLRDRRSWTDIIDPQGVPERVNRDTIESLRDESREAQANFADLRASMSEDYCVADFARKSPDNDAREVNLLLCRDILEQE